MTQAATLHKWVKGTTKDTAGDFTFTFVTQPDPIYVELQQKDGFEVQDGRSVSVSRWTVFVRPDCPVLSNMDEVTINGSRYAFDAEPEQIRHPRTGQTFHWRARLKKAV